MRAFLVWIRRDLWLLILSILLSTTLWVIVNNEQNPLLTITVPGSIPVELRGLPDNMTVIGAAPNIRVNVQARADVVARLNANDFHAYVDLSKAQAGQNALDLPVNVTTDNNLVQIAGTIPDRVEINVEQLQTKTGVPVTPQILDTIAFGLQSGEPKVTPATVNLTGTPEQLAEVDQVTVVIRLAGHTGNIDEQFEAKPVNELGEVVPSVKVTPRYVNVVVPIAQQLTQKAVPVIAVTSGQVALGYGIVGYTVDPPQIALVGEPALLEHITSVQTRPVDVTGARKDTSASVSVDLPPGVSLIRQQSVLVQVFINALDGQQLLRIVPHIVNLNESLNATINPPTVDVVFTGKMPVLLNLRPENIQAEVDLSGLGPGSYTLPVRVVPPASLTVDRVQPDKVNVIITPLPPNTPTPTSPPPAATPLVR